MKKLLFLIAITMTGCATPYVPQRMAYTTSVVPYKPYYPQDNGQQTLDYALASIWYPPCY